MIQVTTMDGNRLRVLRLARSMSLDDLAIATNAVVSKQMLSRYERGLSSPTPRVVTALATALGVPLSRLFEGPNLKVEPVAYRKHNSLKQGDQRRISSLLTNELEQRVRIQEANGFFEVDLPILRMEVGSLEEAENAAQVIRKSWGLGEAPIMSLVDEMESHLVHVIEVDAPDSFDGLSLVAYNEKHKPVAVAAGIRRGVSGDRQRFSLAHELGHILLKIQDRLDEEKAAHRFASAFLAPAASLRRDVGERRGAVDLGELSMLKQRYRMSLAAIVYRLRELGIITENHAAEWFTNIRARGWSKVEPWEVVREEPTWLKRNVHRAIAEGVIRRDEAKSLLGYDDLDDMQEKSERLEMIRMTRDERRRLLEQSVAESVGDYQLDSDWMDGSLEEVGAKDGD
jgi:Zn-dependent peptidase ImmA (M78 family)